MLLIQEISKNGHKDISFNFLSGLTLALAVLLLATPARAGEGKNPYSRPNNSWISISGTVNRVAPDSFLLDYGSGRIKVEMDDGDRDADAYKLIPGDKVTVTGKIDADLFETTTIEAGSVYVEKIGTYFHSSAADEEDFLDIIPTSVIASHTVVQGVVADVDGHEFSIDAGALLTLDVDVSKMPYNPLDDVGIPKIDVGDFVRVSGKLSDSLFTGRELMAEQVIKIID